MSNSNKSSYKGTQQNLYDVARLIWGYCLNVIALFTAKSTDLTAAYVATKLTKIAAAEALPSYEANKDPSVSFKRTLVKKNKAVAAQARSLWKYIENTWDGEERDTKLASAGYGYYNEAAGKSSEKMASLINAANQFLTANQVKLQADGKMPASFPTEFADVATLFTTAKAEYITVKDNVKLANKTKKNANNGVHSDLDEPMYWGKLIYADDIENKNKFTYDEVLKKVRGNHPSGANGFLREVNKKTPIQDVLVKVVGLDMEVMTDERGFFEIHLPSGTYTFEISKEGYETVLLNNKKIEIGSMSRLTRVLVKVPPPAPVQAPAPPPEEEG